MKRLYNICIVVLLLTLVIGFPVNANDNGEIGAINPKISDKLNNLEFLKASREESKPVPESEMIHIVFEKEWLLSNDLEPDPNTVQISFPQKWVVTGQFESEKKDNEVLLEIPASSLYFSNTSKNAGEVCVVFPNYYFEGLPENEFPLAPQPIESGKQLLQDPDFIERVHYDCWAGPSITGCRGRIKPSIYNNPYNETILTYHEIEFYGNTLNDVIEVTCWMEDIYANPMIAFIAYIDGQLVTTPIVNRFVPIGTTVDYEFYTIPGANFSECKIKVNGVWYSGIINDTSSPTHYCLYKGSSEFAEKDDGTTYSFLTYTSPISIESIYTTTWSSASYVSQRLEYDSVDPNQSYVQISYVLNSSGFFVYPGAIN